LCPTLPSGAIVILDNLAPHHAHPVEGFIQARGARLLFSPAYSPDLSPIENAFAKIKQALPRLRAQTLAFLIEAIDHALPSITPFDAIGFFVQAGFLNLINTSLSLRTPLGDMLALTTPVDGWFDPLMAGGQNT